MHSVQELDLDATAAPFFQGQSWVSRTVSELIAFVLDTLFRPLPLLGLASLSPSRLEIWKEKARLDFSLK